MKSITTLIISTFLLVQSYPSISRTNHLNPETSYQQTRQQDDSRSTKSRTTLEELSAFASECNLYAAQCANKVELYEKYRTTANSVIENQAARTVQLKDELAAEKRKNNLLIPILGVAVGFLGGAFLIRK